MYHQLSVEKLTFDEISVVSSNCDLESIVVIVALDFMASMG